MASLQRIKDEHLTCTICHEVFTEPVTLSCHHHFCKGCLLIFTKTKPDAIKQGCLPCATCRHLTPVPNSQKPVKDWAEQLHSGFFVQGLIDALENNTEDQQNKADNETTGEEHCLPCLEEGDTTPASRWCTDCETALCSRCFRLHQRFENTRDHVICDVNDLAIRTIPKLKCKTHHGTRLDLFCQGCGDVICSKCSTTVHRQCSSVISLSKAMPRLRAALEHMSDEIKSDMEEAEILIAHDNHKSGNLSTSLNTALEELEDVTQKLIDVIVIKKEGLRKELEDIQHHDLNKLKNVIQVNTRYVERNVAKLNEILMIRQSGSDVDICLEYMNSRIDGRGRGEAICQNVVTDVTFKARKILNVLEKQGIGTLAITTGTTKAIVSGRTEEQETRQSEVKASTSRTPKFKSQDVSPEPCSLSKFNLKHTLDTKLATDKRDPDINDVIAMKVMGLETIVVADHNNATIKSFFKQEKKQRNSSLKLEATPNNMTQTDENVVAVTVPSRQQIVFILVTPDLWHKNTIKSQNVYNGLVCVNSSTLIAGTSYGIDILNMQGRVLQTVGQQSRLFTSPYYMCKTPQGLVVVSDTEAKRVVFLTDAGEVTVIYSPTEERQLRFPCGVSSSTQAVFIADRVGRKVIQLSLMGDYIKDVLTSEDDLQSPDGIFAVDDKRICVGDKRYVKTFQLM